MFVPSFSFFSFLLYLLFWFWFFFLNFFLVFKFSQFVCSLYICIYLFIYFDFYVCVLFFLLIKTLKLLFINEYQTELGLDGREETCMVGSGNHITKYSSLHYLVLSSSTHLSRTKKEINACE